MGKYWIGNNPNAEVTNAQCVALKNLSTADLTEVEQIISSVDELTTLAGALPVAAEADIGAITSSDAPAGGTGATEGAYDTAANRNLMIASIAAIRVDVAAVRTTVNSLLTKLRTAGIVTS